MKAMVLAAGLGTRLKPLTDTVPKCLVEVGGMPLLESILCRLKAAGVDAAVVNAHHHSGQVADFLRAKGPALGVRLELSLEDPVLETGGGLKKAAAFFAEDEPFLVYNADVVTDLDLKALMAEHRRADALATLAVRDRKSARKLLFKDGRLAGRAPEGQGLAFSGIHACSPRLFPLMTETGVFSLSDVWVRLAAGGALIAPFRHDGGFWADIGTLEKLDAARKLVTERGLPA
ncbi:MAG: nucleotidyltransferase family protein [Elusimicrobia bacterium]|nr:nucleotidyltransferase family protein [Elusimicrobiota bacterium]